MNSEKSILVDTLLHSPVSGEAGFGLAEIYLNENKPLRARYYLENILENNPQAANAKSLLEKCTFEQLVKGVSLCMIVKNEEKNLSRCLASAEPYVDEIIIIDTGSTDNTGNIANAYGAGTGRFEWINDFSAARNRSLERAGCEWVLWLDADDIVPEGQQNTVGEITETPPDRGLFARVASTYKGSVQPEYDQLRFFPNHPEIRFERKIHEQVLPSIVRLGFTAERRNFKITHTGYHDDDQKQKKAERNIRMLEEELKDDPENPALVSALGDSLYATGKYARAAECYEKVSAIPGIKTTNEVLYAQSYVNRALNLLKLEKQTEAETVLLSLLEVYPEKADALFLVGNIYNGRGDKLKAAAYYKQAAAAPEIETTAAVDYKKIQRNSLIKLGRIFMENEEWEKCLANAEEGIKRFPNVLDYWLDKGDALFEGGKYAEAVEVYHQCIQKSPDTADRAYAGLAMCRMVGKQLPEAEAMLKSGLQKFPDNIRMNMLLGDLYYHREESDKAMNYYRKALDAGSEDTQLLWKLASCSSETKEYGLCLDYINRILESEPDNKDALQFAEQVRKLIQPA